MLSLSLSYETNDDLSFLSLEGSYSRRARREFLRNLIVIPRESSTDCAGQISIRRHAHSGRPRNAQEPLYPLWCACPSVISRRVSVPWTSKRWRNLENFPRTEKRASVHSCFADCRVDLQNFRSDQIRTARSGDASGLKVSQSFRIKCQYSSRLSDTRDTYLDIVTTFLKDRIDRPASPHSGALVCTTKI